MAAVKRAIRRLVRLPDGTVGVKYFDLATNMEVLDLTGYDILEPGQDTTLPQNQNDNRDDKQVEINPTSRGSSGGGSRRTTGRDNDSAPSYLSGIKNPAIKNFLTQVEQNKNPVAPDPTQGYDENAGDVTVTPDSEIADREWSGVDSNISEDNAGNVTVSDPNNPDRTSVFTGLDQNRFNPGLQQAVEDSNNPSAAPSEEASNGMFGLGEGLVDRAGLAPGSTGVYSDSMKNLGLGTPAALYTAAQDNVNKGLAPNFSAVRPEAPATGLPAARESVAKSVISNAVRPEGVPSGMPAAKPSQTTIAGRPATPAMTGLPAAAPAMNAAAARPEGIASGLPGAPAPGAVRDTTARAAINQGIMSMDSFATRPADTISAERAAQAKAEASEAGTGVTGGIGSDAVAGKTSTDLGTQPDSSRYGDFGGISKATKAAVNPSTGMAMAPDIGTTANPAGARPEGIAAGMPAARPGNFPSSMSVPGSAKPAGSVTTPSELGKNAGLGGIYGEKSTAQSVISGARDVSTNNPNQGVPQGTAVSATGAPGKPTSYTDAAGYSQTNVSGVRSERNNNPGNLEASSWTQSQPGYIGNDSRFAVFDSYENGVKAQASLLGTKNYQNLTISQAIARYAPPTENNTTAYTKAVADAIGVPSNTKMSQLTPAQRVSMISAMHEVEGGVIGAGITGVTKSLTPKGIAAATAYTGPNTGPDTPSEMGAAGRSGLGLGGLSSGSRAGSGSSGGFSGSGIGAARAADRGSVSGYSGAGSSRSGGQSGSGYGGSGRSSGSGMGGGIGSDHASSGGSGAGKSASGGVSGASRSTAGKTSGGKTSGYGSTGGGGVSGAGVGQGGIGSR